MKLFRNVLKYTILSVLCAGSAISGAIYYFYLSAPEFDTNVELAESTLVFDKNGELLDEVHGEAHRKVVDIEDVSRYLLDAIIAIEDKRFYQHNGIDWKAVIRAAKQNYQEGSIVSGASTITMQTIKNYYLSPEKTWRRKINEAFMALKLEQRLTKTQILEKYINVIYLGNNTYGVETAAETYFNKSASKLELHEAAAVAALIQNPSRFNPYAGEEAYSLLKARQYEVLFNMADTYSTCNLLHEEVTDEVVTDCKHRWADTYQTKPLLVTGRRTWKKSTLPFVSEAALNEFMSTNDLSIEDIKTGGYHIYTTVESKTQRKALDTIDKYESWFGSAQLALISVDVKTNKIKATVGSRDYDISPLNRSLYSFRQPGSAIKPFVYYTAFRYGWTPEHTIDDSEYCIGKTTKWSKAYCPRNYGGSFSGEGTISTHLNKSRNIPAVKIGQIVGISNVIEDMRKLGFTTKLDNVPSFPLGSNDVKPVEIANAYAAFANGGYFNTPTILERVIDSEGSLVVDNTNRTQTKILNSIAVKRINQVLQTIPQYGTGTRAFIPGLKMQLGKTGTTDKQADVWYVGSTDDISTAVWIGQDDYKKKLGYGATGGGWAAPVYKTFVSKYYDK